MKGIVLAGGTGSRLYPLTRVTNKHLLPVYDKPMIFYPLQTLVEAGIRDILIVTGGNNAGEFLRLLQNGKELGLQQLSFAYQEGEGGIADALRLAEPFAKGDKICVVLGDNIIEGSISEAARSFEEQEKGGMVILKQVPDPERFGVPVFEGDRIVRIEEKPRNPRSQYAVIGIYFYDATVFDRIRVLKPSARQEYEITDINNSYLDEGTCGTLSSTGGGAMRVHSNRCGGPATWCAKKFCAKRARSRRYPRHEAAGHWRGRVHRLEFRAPHTGGASGLEADCSRQADLRRQPAKPRTGPCSRNAAGSCRWTSATRRSAIR